MNTKEVVYSVLFEVLWLAFAAILVFLVLSPVRTTISWHFYEFLLGSGFLLVTYFRLIVWAHNSILLKSIWAKLFLFILNIPLFFFVLHYYGHFMEAFDDYNYTLAEDQFQHIRSGTDVGQVILISRMTVTVGVGSLVMVLLMELRLIWLIFKLRQLDRFIKR